MKKLALVFILFVSNLSFSQKSFNNCSAAFLNNKMIVERYEDDAKAKIPLNSKGVLTLCTANISPKISLPVDKISFMIAIKDKNTGTLTLFSNKIYLRQKIEAVLEKCKKGDSIILITTNAEFAVPHNEMLVI